jgi:photosystem II stability/assembly factor-like uncharacterized protein
MKFAACTFLYFLLSANLLSQPTTKSIVESSLARRQKLAETSLLKTYPARNIGPTVCGGRIVDIDVNLKNTKEFYVAFASGGIFRTINNGITFDPVFDNLGALGVGDFVLSQSDPNVLYVGTGEKNSSRSSYAGSGVYKTIDGAKTWKHIGLTATEHISRIIVHPEDINTVWVAAIGSLYSTNSERGVFKSTDGGMSWKKTLFINDSTGVIDLVVNPANPDQLWASSWERLRSESNFEGSGRGSSIYRSDDGGETWRKSIAGFPQGKQVGRIGLEVCPSNPNVVYAILDNQGELPEKKESNKKEQPTLDEIGKLNKAAFLKYDDQKLEQLLRDNRFPSKYSAISVKQDISEGKYPPKALSEYFGGDANKSLFNTKIIGPELYRSDNAGSTWKKMNNYDLEGVFHTYGYYFAEMKVSPKDEDLLYIYGVPLLKSRDGGITWHRIDTLKGVQRVHVDQHAMWINPNDPGHLLLGNDGGLYQSYDEGANWRHINNMPAAQFYTIAADMNSPYNVYGGLQDNGVVRGSSKSIPNITKPWVTLYGGDGMYVAPDPRDSRLVYMGYQFGNYFRLDMEKRKTTKISPQHDIGTAPLRWNWRAPLIISKHNADILYTAAQKVFRSFDQGEHWETISNDLTKNSKQGNIPFSTISSLAESPLKFGLLYAGTDDGQVWVSEDGGVNWDSIQSGLPDSRWVSSVFPSSHDEGTVFISLNGYRSDDFETYIYMSSDYGKSWKSIKGNLPESVANTVIQDPVNADLLYCGLDNGTYVSFDKGTSWNLFNAMLNVSSYTMMVHPRDNELIVGTHGRSAFVADVKPLQALKDGGQHRVVIAFEPTPIQYDKKWGENEYMWSKPDIPELSIQYYVGSSGDQFLVECYDEKNLLVRKLTCAGDAGFHTLDWDVRIYDNKEPPKAKKKRAVPFVENLVYAPPGNYKFKFTRGTDFSEITVAVEE